MLCGKYQKKKKKTPGLQNRSALKSTALSTLCLAQRVSHPVSESTNLLKSHTQIIGWPRWDLFEVIEYLCPKGVHILKEKTQSSCPESCDTIQYVKFQIAWFKW